MSDDLRVEDLIRLACEDSMPAVATLGRVSRALLFGKEAREVELRMLKQSNTVLNERLGAAERETVWVRRMCTEVEDAAFEQLTNGEGTVSCVWLLARIHTLRGVEGREEKP